MSLWVLGGVLSGVLFGQWLLRRWCLKRGHWWKRTKKGAVCLRCWQLFHEW